MLIAENVQSEVITAWLSNSIYAKKRNRYQNMGNIFSPLPENIGKEVFDALVQHENVRIERIISKGHTSPDDDWYDQSENEWLIVLEGSGAILFEDGNTVNLNKGDYLNIPSHSKHKVTWTDPDNVTIWLAVFYK